ncbi:hypothetical protein [Spiroplasma sp. SV19]|uniref:hypothetical protein n=1 Tax=Spiroplasma sp. SV19 TaxID=2570468 RepID=UPI0024B7728C|nr:hypothetical protein [Spiroplasma sp. SV19]WHQ36773.1 hypothetical protein E7Y35_02555 [Spiroplasma sp. SV19]
MYSGTPNTQVESVASNSNNAYMQINDDIYKIIDPNTSIVKFPSSMYKEIAVDDTDKIYTIQNDKIYSSDNPNTPIATLPSGGQYNARIAVANNKVYVSNGSNIYSSDNWNTPIGNWNVAYIFSSNNKIFMVINAGNSKYNIVSLDDPNTIIFTYTITINFQPSYFATADGIVFYLLTFASNNTAQIYLSNDMNNPINIQNGNYGPKGMSNMGTRIIAGIGVNVYTSDNKI